MPIGTVIWYAALIPPQGFLVCNGQSTTGYPALAAIVGATVPDLRGEFIRGLDLGRGVDSGRSIKSSQGDAIRNITGTFTATLQDTSDVKSTGAFSHTIQAISEDGGRKSLYETPIYSLDASRVVPTADENRPRNVALLPCIKY